MKRLAHELEHDPAALGLREASAEQVVELLHRPMPHFSRAQLLRFGPVTVDQVRRLRREKMIAPTHPKVSVIVPAYNAERYISQCVTSILDQTFTEFELIVVDDGSTDATGKILESFASRDPRMSVLTQSNGGTGRALNAGFARARGEYQTWWSADSYVSREWLQQLVSALDAHLDVDFVYSDWAIHHDTTGRIQSVTVPEFDRARLDGECYIGPSWLFRRSLKQRAGEYQADPCEDYAMHLRMASLGSFRRVPSVLGYWRDHAENLTHTVTMPSGWRDSHRAQAREKWRSAGIKVAYVCQNIDPAGVGWWITKGINELLPGVAARHILNKSTAIEQLDDLRFRSDDAEIRTVLDECDIIHCNQVLPDHGPMDLTPWLRRGKRLILHMHGGEYTWDIERIRGYRDQYGAELVTCTPSFVAIVPGARWMPNPIPVLENGMSASHSELFRPGPSWPQCGSPLRLLCHHNYETAKGMDAIRELIRILHDEYRVSIDASVGAQAMGLHTHIEHKKSYDIVVDQLTQGFIGMAGWESLAHGAVVIARLDEYALQAYRRVLGSVPPVLNVPWMDHLAVELMDLAKRPERVMELKVASRQWALEHYHAAKILALWHDLYREVLGQ